MIEICDGQIQFARKNRAVDLPKFSGSKGPEIVAVLDEIKNSFAKYLERIENDSEVMNGRKFISFGRETLDGTIKVSLVQV